MDQSFETGDLGHQFLGYIPFAPLERRRVPGTSGVEEDLDEYTRRDCAERHAGSRDLDQGGGVATEVGGTRNYHHSGGATGGDLGNRPE